MISVEHLKVEFSARPLFSDVSFVVNNRDRIALVGKNGAGKSTMVKCIMGELTDYTGKLELGHNVELGYFAQNEALLVCSNLRMDGSRYNAK